MNNVNQKVSGGKVDTSKREAAQSVDPYDVETSAIKRKRQTLYTGQSFLHTMYMTLAHAHKPARPAARTATAGGT